MTDQFDHLLGNVPDRVVAEKAGVHTSTVFRRRHLLGIPSRYAWIRWDLYDHLLGTDIDPRIASHIGCCTDAVTKRRAMLDIPPYRPTCDPLP